MSEDASSEQVPSEQSAVGSTANHQLQTANSTYPAVGLLVASLSVAITVWAVRGTLPIRVTTTLALTLLPLAGVVPALLAIWRRPRLWPVAAALIALHLITLTFAVYHYYTTAR